MEKVLPKGWVQTKLFDAVISVPTNVKKYEGVKKYYSTGSISYEIIEEGEYDFNSKPSRANREVLENDILQARMKNTNKAFLIDKKYENELFSTGFLQLRPFKNTILSKYIFYYLNSSVFLNQKDELSTGATQQSINDANAGKLDFPLPPLAGQERIVAKLDTLFAQHELMKKALDRIPQLLKDFRLQVLTQAVTGKLTERWREGKDLEEWKNLILLDVILEKPRNGYSPKAVEFETSLKSLSLSATTSGKFDPSFVKYIDSEKPSISSHLWLKNGDILIQRSNSLDYVGTAAIYDGIDFDFIYPDIMMKVRANKSIETKYLYYILSSDKTKKYYRENASGTAGNMPKINQEIVSNTPIFLPSILEQQEIVSRVESLFTIADAIEERYTNLKKKIESLPQAILHKAFKGELVPQMPTDGDAKDLLAEILALKKEVKPKKK